MTIFIPDPRAGNISHRLGEDMSRARKDHAPENLAALRRMARNILQMADKPGVPISHRMHKCAWNIDYLFNALHHMR